MSHSDSNASEDYVLSVNTGGASSVVLVCEHASHFIPAEFDNLGLPPEHRKAHIAWDPGAMGMARHLSNRLDAALIAGGVSRLVYDCNRPPEARDAMPARSEVIDVPGNERLNDSVRAARTAQFYEPFRKALASQIAKTAHPTIVTIHSFTPIYHGKPRSVEIGVLHDSDSRLADAMLNSAPQHTDASVERNQPYGAEHGVTHTLKIHALPEGYLNVMLEVRNDLLTTEAEQVMMADMIAAWLEDAFAQTGADGTVTCAV